MRFGAIVAAVASALLLLACGSATSRPGALTSETMGPAILEALAEPRQIERTHQLLGVFEQLDADNLEAALAAMRQSQWLFEESEVGLFVAFWSRFDPEGALQEAPNWGPYRQKAALASAVLGWAQRDPEAAQAQVEQMAPSYPRMESLLRENLVSGWVYSGRPGALEAVAARDPDLYPLAVQPLVAAQLRIRDVAGVLAWTDESFAKDIDDDLRDALLRRVMILTASREPARVADWLEGHLGKPYAIAGPRLLADQWIRHDVDAALAWIERHTPEEERFELLENGFLIWLRHGFDEARAWIEAAPAEPGLDAAFVAYAHIASRGSRPVESAVAQAERIQDPARRLKALTAAATLWYGRDPVAAETWLQDSPLLEATRQQVRTPPTRRPPRGRRPG